jgi:hypothetical protein
MDRQFLIVLPVIILQKKIRIVHTGVGKTFYHRFFFGHNFML